MARTGKTRRIIRLKKTAEIREKYRLTCGFFLLKLFYNKKEKEMNPQDFLPDFYLSTDFNKECVSLMKESGDVPTPATDGETAAITSWLNHSRKSSPDFATYLYKDCCFQKLNGTWKLAVRNNDYMFVDYVQRKARNG